MSIMKKGATRKEINVIKKMSLAGSTPEEISKAIRVHVKAVKSIADHFKALAPKAAVPKTDKPKE